MATPALQTAEQLRAVARQFSDAADALIARLRTEAGGLSGDELNTRLQQEQDLRAKSNQMYFNATQVATSEALGSQEDLAALLNAANDRIASVQNFNQVFELVAHLLVLGDAVLARAPGQIVASLQQVGADVKVLSRVL
jgi:hypothetical protein